MEKSLSFFPLQKADARLREVWGVGAIEQPDRGKEIMDYGASKPHFAEWSDGVSKSTGGKSLGNVRAGHGGAAAAVGKIISLQFDDLNKRVVVGVKVVDDDAWRKVEEGVYTGFSIGGDYGKRWPDPVYKGYTRYEAIPMELSLVDLPCIPGATFEMVKADGASELRKFAAAGALAKGNDDGVAGELLPDTVQKGAMTGPQSVVAGSIRQGGTMANEPKVTKAAAADPQKAIGMIQQMRNEAEMGGDLEGAGLFSQAIALLLQAQGEEAGEAQPEAEAEAAAETPPQAPPPMEGEQPSLEAGAKAGKLKKAGRTFSGPNQAAMHNVIKGIAEMLVKAGDETAAKILACYAPPPQEKPGESPAEIGAAKSASDGDLLKAVEDMRQRITSLEARPASGGPMLQPATAEKTIAGKELAKQSPAPDGEIERRIAQLEKQAATEPSPIIRAQRQKELAEARQALKK